MTTAAPFPAGGRRLVILTVYSRRGDIDGVLVRAIDGLRDHASELVVVVNGEIDTPALEVLRERAHSVIRRPNQGFDVAAQRDALSAMDDRMGEFDEVILTNDTWYGPMTDFDGLFTRMDATPADFWGLTDHPAIDWIPRHVQSYWVAVRRGVLASEAWRTHWREQTVPATYWDAVSGHELKLTAVLEQAGFTSEVAFPAPLGAGNATILDAAALLEAGCPILKKRVFFFDPPELARRGGDATAALSAALGAGYPEDLLWRHLVRHVAPDALAASCALVETAHPAPTVRAGSRVLVLLDAAVERDEPALLARVVAQIPGGEVRVVGGGGASAVVPPSAVPSSPRRAGGGLRAALTACDGLRPEDWDAVVALRGTDHGAADHGVRHALSSLLDTGALSRLLDDPGLGLVLPLPRPGTRLDPEDADTSVAETIRTAAGIRVPRGTSELRPRDGVWIARPEVIVRLIPAALALAHVDADAADHALGAALASAAAEIGLRTLSMSTSHQAMRTLALGLIADASADSDDEVTEVEPPKRRSLLARLVRRLA